MSTRWIIDILKNSCVITEQRPPTAKVENKSPHGNVNQLVGDMAATQKWKRE